MNSDPKTRLSLRSVFKENGCIETTFKKNIWGYSQMKINGKLQSCHRVSYKEFVAEIPNGLSVLHKCDNPACINPEHLFLGSHHENMLDMAAKGRSMHGVKNPKAKITPEIVFQIRKKDKTVEAWADELGMSKKHIQRLARGLHWGKISTE